MVTRVARIIELTRKGFCSTVGKNILSLYSLQFVNYLLPLITIPYLVRILEPQNFGKIAFSQSLIAYLTIFVGYGFNLSATRKISASRDNPQEINTIVSNVWIAKSLLTIIGFCILVLLIVFIPKLNESAVLLLILFGIVVGDLLFPTWLFLGLEQMTTISTINSLVRIIITAGIFLLIRQPNDYFIYAGLISMQWVGAGIISILIVYRKLDFHFIIPRWADIRKELSDGWPLFLTTGATGFYTAGNALILGLLTNNTVVGYYSAAEKLVRIIQVLIGTASQAIYPRFSKMASERKDVFMIWARRTLFALGSMGLVASIGLFLLAPYIVMFIFGPEFWASIPIIRILAIIPFLVAISNVYGVQIMIPFHHDRPVLILTFSGGLVNLLLAMLLVPLMYGIGMAFAVTISELFVTVFFVIYCHLSGLNPLVNQTDGFKCTREY
ncbi:MAG: flippase [Anaerolineae bacterium]|nr:flippase [Anaerolineae bacterium]